MIVGIGLRKLIERGWLIAGAALLLCLLFPATGVSQETGDLRLILTRAQIYTQKFAEDLALIRYEEHVVQEKLAGDRKVAYKQETLYDSIIRMRFEEGKLRVDEQRVLEKMPAHVESRPLLNTYGFSALTMVFHPYYESSFRFTRGDDDTLQGKLLARVHFEHVPNTPTPILYQMIGADRPMELTGTAWIDPDSGAIYKVDAELGSALADLGVKAIHAELLFEPVLLRDETSPRMLPASVTIDLETPKQHWRNIHRFTDFRKYRTTTNMGVASE
jgi:hypothetical protein